MEVENREGKEERTVICYQQSHGWANCWIAVEKRKEHSRSDKMDKLEKERIR